MLSAAMLGAVLFAQAAAADTPPPQTRFAACIAQIEAGAEHAYEEAMAWAGETHEMDAYRCAAMALDDLGQHEEAARRLTALASAVDGGSDAQRAEIMMQAGNAWLLAHEPGQARSVLTRAITLMAGDRDALPDLYIDRARAYAAEEDWRHSEEDLSQALDLRANDPLALRLRAITRGHQGALDLAMADAQAAVAVEPASIDARLVLGHIREAQRTGAMPVE